MDAEDELGIGTPCSLHAMGKAVKRFKSDDLDSFLGPEEDELQTDMPPDEEYEVNQLSKGDFSKYKKTGPSYTPAEIMEIIINPDYGDNPRRERGEAELCPVTKRVRLTRRKGSIDILYGYDIGKDTYLYPEEALYLLEIGKLLVKIQGMEISIERARHILLENSAMIRSVSPTCSVDEYMVFKHFSKLGYRVRRRKKESNEELRISPMEDTNDSDEAETGLSRGKKRMADSEDIKEPFIYCFKTRKEEFLEEVDSDCEFIKSVEKEAEEEEFTTIFRNELMDEEPTPGPSSRPYQNDSAYFVVETDSDVEIVDEVVFSGVEIVEIHNEKKEQDVCWEETDSSTSPTSQNQVVDLVSSESEYEEEVTVEPIEYKVIWPKCVPHANLELPFPPPHLLPSNIPPRDCDVYKCNFTTKDENLETFVGNLHLDTGTPTSPRCFSSWKEWRESLMEEAREILNESLLAPSSPDNDKGVSRLHLWTNDSSTHPREKGHSFSIPFSLYTPTGNNFHRKNLGTSLKPTHHVAVVRKDEVIPNASFLLSCDNDDNNTPILFAVVGEETILYLTQTSVPLSPNF